MLERIGFQHVVTEIDSNLRDLMWVAYVNRSARKRMLRSRQAGNEGVDRKSREGSRRWKFKLYALAGSICRPIDWFLRAYSVGTMGMRMVARKEKS